MSCTDLNRKVFNVDVSAARSEGEEIFSALAVGYDLNR